MENKDKVERGAQAEDSLEERLNKIIDGRLGKKKSLAFVNVPSLLPTSTPKSISVDKSSALVHVPSLLPTTTPKLLSIDKKCDYASVPTEYWLHWLNEGRGCKLSQGGWGSCVTVIQESFLLLRWKRNVTRSFWWYFKGNGSFEAENLLRSKGEGMLLWISGCY